VNEEMVVPGHSEQNHEKAQ